MAKAAKDSNALKKPLSSYLLFSMEKRAEVKEKNPDAKFGDMAKLLSAQWKALSAEDKKVYEDKAAAAKLEYEQKLASQ